MSKLIISLTAIPPRFRHMQRTLRDLLAQTVRVDEIRLTLPRQYRRFDFDPASLPEVPEGITISLVDRDLGPATKVLPVAQAHRGQDVEILFCDDDHHYPPDWAAAFLAARAAQPDACIARVGYDFCNLPARWIAAPPDGPLPRGERRPSDLRGKLSKWLRPPLPPAKTSGFVQIFEGFAGVMLRPDMLPEDAADIPDHLFTVDDPWISGQLARAGVPIWLQAEPQWRPRAYDTAKVEALLHLSFRNNDRHASEAACIAWFQDHYGVFDGVRHTGTARARIKTRHE